MELKDIQFRTTVLRDGYRNHSVYFQPIELNDSMNSVLGEYKNSKMVAELIVLMKSGINLQENEKIETGSNETFIRISNQDVIFDMEYVTQVKPIKLDLMSAVNLFEEYLIYLTRYENGEIPGLIPAEKLTEWRLVPISHIKDEYR